MRDPPSREQSSAPGLEVIDTINQANDRRRAAPAIAMVIPAVVLHEKLRQMWQRFGEGFDLR